MEMTNKVFATAKRINKRQFHIGRLNQQMENDKWKMETDQ
jgi:hypothetical protein